MNKRFYAACLVLAVISMFLAAWVPVEAAHEFDNTFIIKHEGDVRIVRPNEQIVGIEPGTRLKQYDVIFTGNDSTVDIHLPAGETVRMLSNSRVEVRYAGTDSVRIGVAAGKVFHIIPPSAFKDGQYKVITPTASAVTRGTVFLVEILPNQDTVFYVSSGCLGVINPEVSFVERKVCSDQKTHVKRGLEPTLAEFMNSVDTDLFSLISDIDTLGAALENGALDTAALPAAPATVAPIAFSGAEALAFGMIAAGMTLGVAASKNSNDDQGSSSPF